MKLIRIVFLALFCLIIYSACTSEIDFESTDRELTNENLKMSGDIGQNFPIANGDHYAFEDFEHFRKFYSQVDINDIENGMSSEAETIRTVHGLLVNDEFANPDSRYQPFLTDPVMMAIVNEHFEFQINDRLVTYINNSELLISDPNDIGTREAIRNLTKGEPIDFTKIPKGAGWADDTNEKALFDNCTCDVKVKRISCTEVRVAGRCKNFVWSDGSGFIEISRTDANNSPVAIGGGIFEINEEVVGNFEFNLNINAGDASTLRVFIDPDCLTGNNTLINFDLDQVSCDQDESDTGWLWAQDNGVQGMSHRTEFYENWFSNYSVAEMYSKFFDGSEWKKNDEELVATISDLRRTPICGTYNNGNPEVEPQSCNSCDYRRARVNTALSGDPIAHCTGDIVGTFTKSLDWNGSQWSINATGEPIFECCE